MNEWTIDRILARPNHGLSGEDAAVLRRMAGYFDRASLHIVRDDGQPGRALTIELASDTTRIRLSLTDLHRLHAELRAGQRIDWQRLGVSATEPS